MKIKDNKALREALPKLKPQFLTIDGVAKQLSFCKGRCSMHKEVSDTTLPPAKECCEVDVEKLIDFLYSVPLGDGSIVEFRDVTTDCLAEAIANADVLKWRED